MAVEIERKFRVASGAWREAVRAPSVHYLQAYLAIAERAVVRIRIGNGEAAWLCVKERKVGAARGEYEYPIPVHDAHELLQLAAGEIIEKRRHIVEHGGHVWEVDEFGGANSGLVIAEIELAREDETFERPPWLGEEVTGDQRYYNAALALHPWRQWTERE